MFSMPPGFYSVMELLRREGQNQVKRPAMGLLGATGWILVLAYEQLLEIVGLGRQC